MPESHIILVADPDTGKWSMVVNSAYAGDAEEFIRDLKDQQDPSPYIYINTSDYVTMEGKHGA